jgi:O-antigen ligase
MTGPYENPIDLATYLMMLLLLLFGYGLAGRQRRWPILTLGAALVACLARTEATGAWLGIGVGIVAMMCASARMRWHALALLGLVGLAGVLFLKHTGRFGDLLSPAEIGKVDRWAMWQAALGMIQDRPLFGHGVNTFMSNYLDYWVGGEHQPRYAHNCYLQMTAETGLAGLVTFLWLLGCLFERLVAALRRLRRNDQMLLVGALASLVAFVIHSAVDTNFYSLRQAALFWTIAGLTLGWSQRAAPPSHATGLA